MFTTLATWVKKIYLKVCKSHFLHRLWAPRMPLWQKDYSKLPARRMERQLRKDLSNVGADLDIFFQDYYKELERGRRKSCAPYLPS